MGKDNGDGGGDMGKDNKDGDMGKDNNNGEGVWEGVVCASKKEAFFFSFFYIFLPLITH